MVSSTGTSSSKRWMKYTSMWSVPSRRSDASHWAWIAARDNPAPVGPSCIRPDTFVASTMSCRRAYRRTARPTNSSEVPCWYTFAVSQNVTPSSTACRKNGCAASSSSVHECRPAPGSP